MSIFLSRVSPFHRKGSHSWDPNRGLCFRPGFQRLRYNNKVSGTSGDSSCGNSVCVKGCTESKEVRFLYNTSIEVETIPVIKTKKDARLK